MSMARTYREIRRLLEKDRPTVQADHADRLRAAVAAARQAPFYRERLAALPPDFSTAEYEALPEVTRGDLRDHHEEMLNPSSTDPPQLDATGGSTGTPTPFYRTRTHRAFSHAMDHLVASWVGGGLGTRTVVLWGAQMDAAKSPMTLRRRLEYRLRGGVWLIDCFKMDEGRCRHAREVIERTRPEVVRGYRSILLEFASYLEATGPLRHTPKAVLSAAELLLPEHRRRIEERLGAPVFDRYGSREAGMVAGECPEQRLHVLEPAVRVEAVSQAGVNVPGEAGYLLVTTLNNSAMPLLRYRIGDGACWHGYTCDCGLPLPVISMEYGREAAMVRLAGGQSVYPMFFHHHLRDHTEIEAWQLVRHGPDALDLCVCSHGRLSEATRADIEARFQQYLGDGCTLRVREEEHLQRNRTGKVELLVDRSTG